ncbi:helix-turn-helix domain-containing protein [Bacillus songklensis]|uniref:Helix-turn-helix domain-containing protein n=1 Tax=Bacillus songklensis TaxID=1069116 RepID=A0ABV8AYN0_9BACI
MEITKQIISLREVMELLNISAPQTVYNYINQQKLTPINKDDWHIEGRYEFDLEDVLRLKEELTAPGLTTSEAAKELGVSQQTVNKYIKQKVLPAFQAEYRGIRYNFIHREDLEQFKETHEIGRKPSKKHFYHSEKNIGLFQLFVNKKEDKERLARIVSVEEEIMAVTEEHEELTLEQLLEKGYEPAYTIESKKAITKEGYAVFKFKQTAYAKSSIYKLIDLFYQCLSPVNMRIELQKDQEQYLVEVKPALIEESSSELFELLQSILVSGKLNKRNRGIYIDSDLEVIRMKVTSELKERLEEKRKELGKGSIEELLLFAAEKL